MDVDRYETQGPGIDLDRIELPQGRIGVGPWLEPLLPSGIGAGDVVLAFGWTGVGATTLALTVAAYSAGYAPVMWFSAAGCEWRDQLMRHMKRLNAWHPNVSIADDATLADVVRGIAERRPALAVVDRLQDLVEWQGPQVQAAYDALQAVCAETGTALWVNAGVSEGEGEGGHRPWGLAGPLMATHLFALTRPVAGPHRANRQAGRDLLTMDRLVVTDTRTRAHVGLRLNEAGLFLV